MLLIVATKQWTIRKTTKSASATEMAPLSTDSNVCFVDMPSQRARGATRERAPHNLRPEFHDPSVDRGWIDVNATFCKKIPHIPIRQQTLTIPAYRMRIFSGGSRWRLNGLPFGIGSSWIADKNDSSSNSRS